MRKFFLLLLVVGPSLANLIPVFMGSKNWLASLGFAVGLLVLNLVVWRKTLYAAYLGFPLKDTGDFWPHRARLRNVISAPTVTYFKEVVLSEAVATKLPLRFFSGDAQNSDRLLFSLMHAHTYLATASEAMKGRAWRKVAPQFEAFMDAYLEGFDYGAETFLIHALDHWEDSRFNERFIKYMAAVGPSNALVCISEDMPLDYALALREERR